MLQQVHPARVRLAGQNVESSRRFRIEITAGRPVVMGVDDMCGFLVDDRWPDPGHLGRERVPMVLRVPLEKLSRPLFVHQLLLRVWEVATTGSPVVIDWTDS